MFVPRGGAYSRRPWQHPLSFSPQLTSVCKAVRALHLDCDLSQQESGTYQQDGQDSTQTGSLGAIAANMADATPASKSK
jgi:hypothetical protein